jgi:hypothetical protein
VFPTGSPLSHHLPNNRSSKMFPLDQVIPFVLSDLSVDPHMTSPATWHHNSITSFINNNKNEQPKESLHMIMLIIFPTKFRRRTYQIKYEFKLTKTYSWSDFNAHLKKITRLAYSIRFKCRCERSISYIIITLITLFKSVKIFVYSVSI